MQSPAIVKLLLSQEKKADETLKILEQNLQDYGWTKCIVTSLIRLWTKGYYYQFSESYFEFFEELTDQERGRLQNYTILNTKLSPGYFNLFTNIGAVVLVKVENVITSMFGKKLIAAGSYGTANALYTCLLMQLDSFTFYWGGVLGFDAEHLVNAMPIIRWITGLGLTMGIYASGFGFGTASLAGYIAFGYIIASLCRDISGYAMDRLLGNATSAATNSRGSRVLDFTLKFPVQHLSYLFGAAYLAPTLHDKIIPLFITPPRDELLTNSNTCMLYQKSCKKEALKTLGFNDAKCEPTAEQIHVAWRNLMSVQHPDKNPNVAAADTYATELNNARDRLRDMGLSTRLE